MPEALRGFEQQGCRETQRFSVSVGVNVLSLRLIPVFPLVTVERSAAAMNCSVCKESLWRQTGTLLAPLRTAKRSEGSLFVDAPVRRTI